MSRINREIFTTLDVNGPYLRIDTQPTSITSSHNGDAVFTIGVSTYYLVGDEADTAGTEDATAPTVDDDGNIIYEWYEIDANASPGTVTKLTDSTAYTGTTTNTLTVKSTQSPGSHLNQYYCIVSFDPTLVSGKYNTGDAVNESLTSDTVTLNVKPYIIINTQPVSTVTGFNPSSSTLSTKASLSDTRSPWQNYKLEYQWWEKNKENVSIVPNTRLIDGDYEVVLSTSKTVEQVVNNTQFTTLIESVSSGVSKRVGIPTEATEVTFTISGGIGGSGGDENSSNPGGIGGAGKSGEFKFSDSEINNIRNAGAPTEYILSSGSKGDDGATQISVAGGIGGLSFDQDVTLTENDSLFGGRGGSSGPGGVSGSGGGGGGGSAVISSTGQWMVIAGGGGGGAGSSPEAQGTDGQDADDWKEFDIINSINPNELKPATVVNFNPKAGTTQGNNIQNPIQYGFYIKSASPISSVNATTDYRVIVVWDNEVVVDTTSKLTQFDQVGIFQSLIDGKFYVTNGNVNYFVSTHKGSELGWCDDESNLSSVCVRGDGGYVNSFDVIRYSELFSSGNMTAHDGAIGESKLTGDGGGGGGAGGGAISPAAGGTAGANPVASNQVVVQFKVSGKNNTGSDYIKFVEVPWYGFPETQPNRGQTVTFTENDNIQTVTLKAGVTYDVISNFEEGDRTSDSLRILQDFTPDANQSDIIAGRSIGMNAGGVGDNIQTGNEDDFRDLIVSVSDGTFDVVPQTVRLEDGEIVGKSIIRYTAPTGFKNQTVASGGQGGQSQYNAIRLSKLSGSKNDSIGAVNMTIRTEQPFNELNQAIVDSIVRKNWSVRGAHPYTPYKDGGYTSTLEISSNYVFSKRIVCQITVKDTGVSPVANAQTSFTNSLYTDAVDFTVVDDRDNIINIERIRHNDDFAIVSSLNLDNSDITFERSGSTNTKDVEYYSFYSNRDIEVDIQMYGGKGNDQGAYVGGEGGFSYLRLNMEKDTEYVIAGLNDYVNTPFLFKKGRLLAVVGGGGDAGYNGNGAPGGGVSVNGGSAYAGGVGGSSPTILGENGVHGSATNLLPIAPDTKASIPNGGTTVRCSKGNLFQFANQPNPCADRGTNVKFATSDGTLVTNTKEINRGFKAGYNILNTAGRSNGAVVDIGWGGCGATGGQGSDTHGGGGGSGYIAPEDDLGIRVRSEGNSERVASLTTQSGLQGSGGNPISSTLGGSTGPARVVISLAEIPTDNLDEFIERPVAPTLAVSEEDVQREPEFIPLPEIVPPPPVTPPTPVLSITSAVSKGFVSGDKTYTSFSDRSAIGVLESGSIDFFVKTEDIPANTKFYWKVEKINSYGGDEFDATSGDFKTSLNSNGDVVGQFNVSPKVDNKTDWIDSIAHDWRIRIYTDANYNYEVNQNFNGRFRILDNSRTAPTAKLTSLSADTTTGVKINNEMNEHDSITIQVETLDIHNGQTIGWEIVHITTSDADFLATSGTATVSSGYQIDDDGIPSELNSNKNRGTTSFIIETEDDTLTEGPESFALRLKYPTSSNTYFVDTKNAIGEVKKSIRINDTSQDPEADISGNDTINEGALTTYTLATENFRTGELIYWRIVDSSNNVANSDFTGGNTTNASGTATVTVTGTNSGGNRTGEASIIITATADETTEGTETFTLQLYRDSSYNTVVNTTPGTNTHSTKSITVNDTSRDPEADISGNDNINEGVTTTYTISTENFRGGATIYWRIVDSSNNIATSDFGTSASGTAAVTETGTNSFGNRIGETSITITATEDQLTEGTETFTLQLYRDSSYSTVVNTINGSTHSIKSITVNDTSQNPEADISGNDNINEGVATTYTLATENFRTGGTIYWRIVDSSNNVANSDFTGGSITNASGTAVVTETGTNSFGNRIGTTSITITADRDETTEGTETFTLQLYRDSSYSIVVNTTPGTNTHSTKSITVNDSSRFPEADISGNDNIDEGISTTYTLSTETFRTGELIYWRIVDSSNNIASDFASATGTAAVTVTGTNSAGNRIGTASIIITANEDQITEGSETFTLQLYRDSSYSIVTNTTAGTNTHSTKSITVNDTSQDPEADISGNDDIDEGVATTYTLSTENFRGGQLIYWRIVDSSNNIASDFASATGTAEVTDTGTTNSAGNRIGTASIIITANEDTTTEGTETFTLQLYKDSSYSRVVNTTDGSTHSIKSITVNDTSQDPEADISGADIINEGVATTYTLATKNFRGGATIYWRIIEGNSGTTVANSDFTGGNTTNASGTATVTETGINSAGNRTGTASITITATADQLTEGTETFTLQLYRDSSYSIVVNTTPGTNTHSTKSITVNDTSLGPTQYDAEIAGIDFTRRDCFEGKELRFIPRAWNLTADETGHDVYWIILDSNGEPAVQGTAEPGDFTPINADRTTIPDFNVIRGQTTFKLKGYSKASGNAFTNPTIDVSQGYIVPVHQNIDDDQKFTAISDFFSDGAKDFKIAYFATESDRDSLSNAKFTTPAFTVKDSSRTKIAFNGETGFGVDASSGRSRSRLLSPGQSLDNPSVDEGKIYFFRVETSAPPGTQLFYKVGNDSTDGSDFGLVEIYNLPDTRVGSYSYPIKPNTSITDAYSGRVTTFDRDGNSRSQKIDGVECVRSIAYIYLKIAADSTTEGEESFNLGVYLSETYDTNEPYVTQTIKINDTSENIDPPKISLSLSSPAGTFSGNADTGYSVTASDTSVTEITLKWTLSGGDATSGTFRGTGFDNNYYASSDTININDTWYTGSSQDGGRLKAVAKGTNDFILTYNMSISNQTSDGTVQTASDRVSLTVSSLSAPEPPRLYKKYRAVPIWRYHRESNSGKPRWAHTTFGPGAAEAPSDPHPTNTPEWREYWGKQLFDRIGSENGKPWSLVGAFGTVFTRQAPGTTSLLHPTRGLDGDETRGYAGLFDNYQSNAFAYLNASIGGSGIPFYYGDEFFGAIPTWGLNTYGLGDASGIDANGNPTDPPYAMGDLWTLRITDSNGNPDGVNGQLYDKWVGPPRPSVSGGEWHYWEVTDGTPVYDGTSEPDGDIIFG